MTRHLQKGENVVLNVVSDLVITTEWQTKTINPPLEIDVSAFLLNNDKVTSDTDFIFYNQPRSLTNAVLLKDRRFKVNLKQLAPDINRIAFVLSIHEAQHRKHSFSLVSSVRIKVFDFLTRQEIINYHLDDANSETAIVLATLYNHQNTWKFRAVGQGYESGLSVLARNFGVTIESESMPAVATTEPELVVNEPQPDKRNKLIGWIKHTFIADTKTTDKQQKRPDIQPLSDQATPEKVKEPKPTITLLADSINIHDTDALTQQSQYEPITPIQF